MNKKSKVKFFKSFKKKFSIFSEFNKKFLEKIFTKFPVYLTFTDRDSYLEKYQNLLKKFRKLKAQESLTENSKKNLKKKSSSSKQLLTFVNDKKIFSFLKNFKISKEKLLKKEKIKKISNYKFLLNKKLKNFDISYQILDFLKSVKISKEKFKFSYEKKNQKYNQTIGIIFYSDHNLIFLSLNINLENNNIKIKNVTEIPVPASVIGDSLVEDINELANITLDSLNLIGLFDSPLLVVLSSSFFNVNTFLSSDLKQISETDSKVKSKSPYLPANTHAEFRKIAETGISNEYVRTIYSNKDFIKSWTDTLEIIDLPIIGLLPAGPLIFEELTNRLNEEVTVLVDIESTSTTLFIGNKSKELESQKLPFGFNLYLSDNLQKSSFYYFDRVLNSIKLFLKESNHTLPKDIFVMGKGLDNLLTEKSNLPEGFKSISELKMAKYSYNPKNMNVHELISKSINSSVESLACILNSCV